MFRFLLIRLWPVLIPLALFFLWYAYKRWRFRTTGERVYLADGPWKITVIAMLVFGVFGFVGIRLLEGNSGPATYEPPHMVNGEVVQGEISPITPTGD